MLALARALWRLFAPPPNNWQRCAGCSYWRPVDVIDVGTGEVYCSDCGWPTSGRGARRRASTHQTPRAEHRVQGRR